jgi:nucleotide-binding universal stress UspA family protein
MATSHPVSTYPSVDALTERVICAVDGSAQSDEAVRQGAILAAPREIDLVSVADPSIAVHGGFAMGDLLDKIETDTQSALVAASELATVRETKVLHGDPAATLVDHLRDSGATLVAAGTHGHRRVAGILMGTVATRLLHDAPCSVLIARPSDGEEPFPARILVGVDGSPESAAAAVVAQELAARFGAECVGLTATGGKPVDLVAARAAFSGTLEQFPAGAATALVATAPDADLLVVGSRGLHGLQALGSVSERVAHRAACSVLVVRPTPADAD